MKREVEKRVKFGVLTHALRGNGRRKENDGKVSEGTEKYEREEKEGERKAKR